MLKEYDDMKEEIKSLKTSMFIKDFSLFIKQCYRIVWNIEKIRKNLSCKGVIIRLLSNYAVWNQTIRKKIKIYQWAKV